MQKITRIEDFSGKTIRMATESVDGREVVIVFNDDDWATLRVDYCSCEDSLVVANHYHNDNVRNYLSPDELLRAELVTQAQCDQIKKEAAAKEAERKRKCAEMLLAEAAELEQLA